MTHKLVIEPDNAGQTYWRDLWQYRELFVMLAWRDVAVRYKQTLIGVAWAVLRPVMTMLAFTFVFGTMAHLSSEGGAPYALMVFVAMLPWQFFSTALTSASESLVSNTNLVSKVYFPRLLVPAATIAVSVVDFLLSVVVLVVMMVWYQYAPPVQVIAVIPLTLLTGILALGPGVLLAAVNVKYRDLRYALPFVTQFGLYVTPVGFSSSLVPERWRLLYECNPMVGIVDGFRWAILGSIDFPTRALAISTGVSLVFLWFGIRRFRATEALFVDVI
ncbi:MAG: ABC transporter permease [Kofleriaceae bacterium]